MKTLGYPGWLIALVQQGAISVDEAEDYIAKKGGPWSEQQ